MARLETDKGQQAMIMGCPMGPAVFSAADFVATHPETGQAGILFGIDPTEPVELTVTNEFDQEITQTFHPGPNPYLFKKIKKDATETIVVNYFI